MAVAIPAPVRHAFKFKGFRLAVHSPDDDADSQLSVDHFAHRAVFRRAVHLQPPDHRPRTDHSARRGHEPLAAGAPRDDHRRRFHADRVLHFAGAGAERHRQFPRTALENQQRRVASADSRGRIQRHFERRHRLYPQQKQGRHAGRHHLARPAFPRHANDPAG